MAQDRNVELNKLSEDDNDLVQVMSRFCTTLPVRSRSIFARTHNFVQRLATVVLRNELPSSFAFRSVNISPRHYVEVSRACCMLLALCRPRHCMGCVRLTFSRKKFSAQDDERRTRHGCFSNRRQPLSLAYALLLLLDINAIK